jgi:hypothetical protein
MHTVTYIHIHIYRGGSGSWGVHKDDLRSRRQSSPPRGRQHGDIRDRDYADSREEWGGHGRGETWGAARHDAYGQVPPRERYLSSHVSMYVLYMCVCMCLHVCGICTGDYADSDKYILYIHVHIIHTYTYGHAYIYIWPNATKR